jgi:hypothetical protein
MKDRQRVSVDDLAKEILSERLNEATDKIEVSEAPTPHFYVIYANGKIYYHFGGTMTKAKFIGLLVLLAGTAGWPQLAEIIKQFTAT